MNTANEHGGDAALLAAIGAGDQTAFAALYDRYSHPAYRLAYLILGEREATEAVVLMAFMRLWQVPGDYAAARFPCVLVFSATSAAWRWRGNGRWRVAADATHTAS